LFGPAWAWDAAENLLAASPVFILEIFWDSIGLCKGGQILYIFVE